MEKTSLRKGFTLLELVVVIVILAVIAVIALHVFYLSLIMQGKQQAAHYLITSVQVLRSIKEHV
ncbi:prepilin-type N-terminal cleavage/methylation domain-containing protein [Vibrio lentus]|uniref:prepilin-type N-terminal cleavage/methylation domain-containing protein n=1 Tax=Vibrio lentus TaxID=136468 RepID=UPI001F53B490|nr:prepilin-type N-terminal cleavage/methylation domain-containing protein [Vibrio lentus]